MPYLSLLSLARTKSSRLEKCGASCWLSRLKRAETCRLLRGANAVNVLRRGGGGAVCERGGESGRLRVCKQRERERERERELFAWAEVIDDEMGGWPT